MAVCILCVAFLPEGAARERASSRSAGPQHTEVTCPRCGTYRVEERFLAAKRKEGLEHPVALALSALARDAYNRGGVFEVTLEGHRNAAQAVRKSFTYRGRVDRILLDLVRRAGYPGEPTQPFNVEELAAAAGLPVSTCMGLLSQLQGQGWIGVMDTRTGALRVGIEPKAWDRVDELQSPRAAGDRAFVAMSFAFDMAAAYEEGIKPALIACGFSPPFRVDDPEHDARAGEREFKQRIDDRILAEIRGARLLVADVTHARPAVYFEAGLAEGLGIPIVWTCRESNSADMCFDTRQNAHILWVDPHQLRQALTDRIRARNWGNSLAI